MNRELGKTYQEEQRMPKYLIEYPLIAYNGPYQDSRELTIGNLADTSAAQITITLEDLKFICFV